METWTKKAALWLGVLIIFSNSAWLRAQKPPVPLKELARSRDIDIGTAISVEGLEKDPRYCGIAAREFNVITPENAFKFRETEPWRNFFTFTDADRIVAFAESNHMKIRGHTLVWYQNPSLWLKWRTYSKQELEEILHHHISNVVRHFKGKLYSWDVVNEAFEDDGSMRKSIWYDTIGPDYIEKTFRWAHEADPKALLFYNDYGAEEPNAKSDAIWRFLKKLKSQGVPVDGIGFQAHFNTKFHYEGPLMNANLKRFAQLGLETDFTELDVAAGPGKDRDKSRKDQANLFKTVLGVCLNNPSCKMVILWGFSDPYSWEPDQSPNIFDGQYNPKPAYFEIQNALSESPSS